MIKIHSGLYKGRNIKRVNIDSTKETSSMVREALFNSLYRIEGNVLDLFAGSGSLGITAISLGAKSCIFVDNNIQAVKTIKENLSNLSIDALVYRNDYESFLKTNETLFDYVFLDPPYNFNDYEYLLNLVSKHTSDSSYIILEIDKKTKVIETFNSFNLVRNKAYGSKRVVIYTNNQ